MSESFVSKLGKLWRKYDVVGYLDNEFAGGLWNSIIANHEEKLTHYEETLAAAREWKGIYEQVDEFVKDESKKDEAGFDALYEQLVVAGDALRKSLIGTRSE